MKKLQLFIFAFLLLGINAAKAQTISTYAGNGTGGYSGDGGQATAAEIDLAYGIYVDNSGNLFLSDWGNHRERKITKSTGIITTIVGNGGYNYSGDGGQAAAAEIHSPYGIALDASGNVYINDEVDDRIRKITVSTGIINSIVGNGTAGFSGDGGQATAA